jgi:hypothetical protein
MASVSRRTIVAGSLAAATVTSLGPPTRAASAGGLRGRRGAIANSIHRGEALRTALFFAGPPNPASLPLYTRHPTHANRLDWSNERDVRCALRQFRAAGLNTVKLSYFGHEGETDQWAPSWLFSQTRWPGHRRGLYTKAEQVALTRRFFRLAAQEGLLVAPLLEVSPAFPFYEQFPADVDELVRRASWLLDHFGRESSWLHLHDRNGRSRPAIWLIETIHAGEVDPVAFAAGFDRAAALVKSATGRLPGFVIDPTSLPAYGAATGPEPTALSASASVLAVNPFNITSQGPGEPKPQAEITEGERQLYAQQVLQTWSGSGLPLVAPINPGYDAHIVFPDSGRYGFNVAWRRQQAILALTHQTAGISVDCWNGWTEGYAIPASHESGDTEFRWVRRVLRHL